VIFSKPLNESVSAARRPRKLESRVWWQANKANDLIDWISESSKRLSTERVRELRTRSGRGRRYKVMSADMGEESTILVGVLNPR